MDDDFRNFVWEDTSLDSDEAEAQRPAQCVDSLRSSDDTIRNAAGEGPAASCVRSSSSRPWKVGESITSIVATAAVYAWKLRESFDDQRAHASVTGSILGKGTIENNIRVRCTNLRDAEDMENRYNQRVFANAPSALSMRGRNSVVILQSVPLAAGAGACVSNSTENMQLALSSASSDQSASKIRLEEMSCYDQADIPSASRSAQGQEIARIGKARKRAQDQDEEEDDKRKERSKCSHGKRRSHCKECGGSAFCRHGRWTRLCKECGGSAFCDHGKRRSHCKECGGSAYCSHGKERAYCKDCGGSAICIHSKQRSHCKECGGSAFCSHGKQKRRCKDCGGSAICIHSKRRSYCKECGGSAFCSHGKQKRRCRDCKPPASAPVAQQGDN